MRRTHAPHVFVAVGLALLAAAAGAVLRAPSSHAAPSGLIVFASDRDKVNPGEIYSLATGTAPRDVSRSPAADYGLAVAPAGDPAFSPDGTQIAFDAAPAHPLGLQTAIMVANADGSGVRTLSTAPFRRSGHPAWQPA